MRLFRGDCLEVMRQLDDKSVDAIVTDPPYGLSFMGKRWDATVPSVDIWQECLRVLKPGGHLLAFAGTRTQHRMAVNIEDAGFEIRDLIAWVYGQGFPKSHNLDGEWQGWGTALKPALEPVTVARKQLTGSVAENVQEWGTGALNIDGCRVGIADNTVRRNGVTALFLGAGSNPHDNKDGMGGGHNAGRWPANLIHDGSDEVVGIFPEVHGAGAARTGSKNLRDAKHKPSAYNLPRSTGDMFRFGDSGTVARFFYCAKTSRSERGEGNTHPTVKPIALMRYLCRLVTRPGGVVLDPFMGSGTTGIAALKEGFDFIGIEREEAYFEISKNRIEHFSGVALEDGEEAEGEVDKRQMGLF